MQGIGYKEMFDYFDGMYDIDTAKELIKRIQDILQKDN